MFRIIHLLAGIAALLLSFIPTFGAGTPDLLQRSDVVYLIFCGLFNLLAAGLDSQRSQTPLQIAASVLMLLAVAVQAYVIFAPLPLVADQPAVLLALTALIIASMLRLAGSLPKRSKSSASVRSSSSTSSSASQGEREGGTVKWFNTSKGFGFISRDSGDDIFVHFRAIRGEGHRVLVEGQRVEFTVMNRDKGLQAEDVVAGSTPKR